MKRHFIVALVALTWAIAVAQEPGNAGRSKTAGWVVKERLLPLPIDSSDELVKALSEIAAPDVRVAKEDFPKNDAEWISSVAAVDKLIGKLATNLARQRGVSVESDEIEGVKVHWITPSTTSATNQSRIFLFTHGGAYTSGYGISSLLEAVAIADGAKIKVLSVDYRMPPKHPFPIGLNEVVAVYKRLLTEFDSSTIGFGGTSAGGGLALASVHQFIELGLPVPGALFAGTPWADLTKTGDSYFINEGIDRVLISFDGRLRAAAAIYAGGVDLKSPLISPVYGDFEGFPPTYLVSGTRDLFLSNTIRVHRKLRRAGIVADLNVYEGMSHGEYFVMPDLPEAKEIYAELGSFLNQHLN